MSQNCRSAEQAARDYPGGNPVDLLAIRRSPDFGPEEPQASLNQTVVQVREHHVVATRCGVGVECDRALLLSVGVQKPGQARLPGGIRKSWNMEGGETIFQSHRNQLGLPRQIEGDMHHSFDIRASPFSRAYAPQEGRGAPAAQERDKERCSARKKKGGERRGSRLNGIRGCLRCSDASKGGSSPCSPCPSLKAVCAANYEASAVSEEQGCAWLRCRREERRF